MEDGAGWQRCGKTRHASFPEVMKTDGNKDLRHTLTRTHVNTHKRFTDECTAPIRGTEDRARLHFSCSRLSRVLTQIYCKEMAAQIGPHVQVGGKKTAPRISRSEKTPTNIKGAKTHNAHATLPSLISKPRVSPETEAPSEITSLWSLQHKCCFC